MNSFDCYAIADALLRGNQASRMILVDWLCDVGDEEEANFIRRASSSRAGDLYVAIRQIPCPHVVELGCDFIEHCVDRKQTSLYSLLGRVRRLLKRGGPPQQTAAAVRSLAEYKSMERYWYDAAGFYAPDDAVHSFANAFAAVVQPTDSPRAAAVAVTATSRLLRGANLGGVWAKKQRDQLGWQIKRTRELLGQLAMQGG
jgi:hypothetical protein